MKKIDLAKLTDDELRALQGENPPNNSDASNPANTPLYAIMAEGKRRGLW